MSGSHVVTAAALKILQTARATSASACVSRKPRCIRTLHSRPLGYANASDTYGAFELEFIVAQGRMLLIDFKRTLLQPPRVRRCSWRGSARMVYAGATGATEEPERLVSRCRRGDKEQPLVFCNGFGLSLSLAAQQIFKKMSREEAAHWLEWRKTYESWTPYTIPTILCLRPSTLLPGSANTSGIRRIP